MRKPFFWEESGPRKIDSFQKFREQLKVRRFAIAGTSGINRFRPLDHQPLRTGQYPHQGTPRPGRLHRAKVRRLRHLPPGPLRQSRLEARPEVIGARNVVLVVDGSITIPRVRRAFCQNERDTRARA
jgi:hypothetical protein